MFDCNSFLRRKGWVQKELAKRLNIATSTVGMWCTGKSTPSYDVIVDLIKLGLMSSELFGPEISELLLKNSSELDSTSQDFESRRDPIDYKDPEFQEIVQKAILEIEARKQKGII